MSNTINYHTGQPITDEQQALMKRIADMGQDMRRLVHDVYQHINTTDAGDAAPSIVSDPLRWLELATDDMQFALMKLRRAVIFNPNF